MPMTPEERADALRELDQELYTTIHESKKALIDHPMIAGLVKAMERRGVVVADYGQGSLGKDYHEPYISCFVPVEKLTWFAEIVSGVTEYFQPRLKYWCDCQYGMQIELSHDGRFDWCQQNAPPGHIALNIRFSYYPRTKRTQQVIQAEIMPSFAYVVEHYPDGANHDVPTLIRLFFWGAELPETEEELAGDEE